MPIPALKECCSLQSTSSSSSSDNNNRNPIGGANGDVLPLRTLTRLRVEMMPMSASPNDKHLLALTWDLLISQTVECPDCASQVLSNTTSG